MAIMNARGEGKRAKYQWSYPCGEAIAGRSPQEDE